MNIVDETKINGLYWRAVIARGLATLLTRLG
jgi:hypothetical protein